MIGLYELLTRKMYNHEHEIQRDYFSILEHKLELQFVNKWNTDGYTSNRTVNFLTEFKRSWDLTKKEILCRCLIQTLVYISVLEREEAFIPQYTFIATESFYCFFETSLISDYRSIVSGETDASSAWKRHPDLIKILIKQVDIPVYKVSDRIEEELLNLFYVAPNKSIQIKPKSIDTVLRLLAEFTSRNIILDELTTHELAYIVLGIMTGDYKPLEGESLLSTTLTKRPQINIDKDQYNEFIILYETIKDPEIIDEIVSNKSELIDQLIRRYEGEFFTPQPLVELGNHYLQKVFGKKWRETNAVHEATWGLGQLTRKHEFSNLFCSTINQEDIDFASNLHYNDEAIKFQYDWLNDDCELSDLKYSKKLPSEYIEITSKFPLIMISNWPYGAAGDDKTVGSAKDSIANKTKIHSIMKDSSISFHKAMENLYTQCLYRCVLHKKMLNKKDFFIACYCPMLFLTGPGFKALRDVFFEHFKLEAGFVVPAKVFNSLSADWPIMFCIFSSGKQEDKNSFILDFYDENLKFNSVEKVFNVDIDLRSWVAPNNLYSNHQFKQVPIMASALNVGKRQRKEYVDVPAKWPTDVFSLLVMDSNNIEKSRKSVYIINCGIRSGLGRIKINNNNFYHCMAAFTARKSSVLIYDTDTAKKEFSQPDINNPSLNQYMVDSVIYSLFNDSSQQASLKNVISCGSSWTINNELFWQSKELMIALSKKFGNRMVYAHATKSNNRFLYNELTKIKDLLSDDAKNVLNMADELLQNSFYKRDQLQAKDKHLNINRWDAGWHQIKHLIKYCEINLDEFVGAYKELEGRLLEETIKLGFLRI